MTKLQWIDKLNEKYSFFKNNVHFFSYSQLEEDRMLIDLKFDSEDGWLRVPKINLHLFQGMLYDLLPAAFAKFLHDTGFETEKRRFKLFAFSWPRGKGRPSFTDKHIVLKTPVQITIASPVDATVSGLSNGVLGKSNVRIGNSMLFCTEILARNPIVDCEEISVYTLSPITCYSTLYKKTGEPYTLYHSPVESEFISQIHTNLARKYTALFPDRTIPEGNVRITPLGEIREQVARFRPDDPRPIKGWWGRFRLRGPRELLQTALDCGLGAKNSAGFGCVEPARSRNQVDISSESR